MNLREILEYSITYLHSKNITDPQTDAAYLISGIMGISKNNLPLHYDELIPFWKKVRIQKAVRRRGRLEPVAMILGYQYFFQGRFLVDRKTLIPRADTEHLIYAVQESGRNFKSILDIGTGSGAIAISLSGLFPESGVIALDRYIRSARKNILLAGVKNIRLIRTDFFRWKPSTGYQADLIISNPPYLGKEDFVLLQEDARRYEPRRAFYGGEDGLDFYRGIADFGWKYLSPEGLIIVETDHKWESVRAIFRDAGFTKTEVRKDYGGLERVLVVGG